MKFIERDVENYWIARCPECGWRALSRDCLGGGPIGDTGDFDECYCRRCHSIVDEDNGFTIFDRLRWFWRWITRWPAKALAEERRRDEEYAQQYCSKRWDACDDVK